MPDSLRLQTLTQNMSHTLLYHGNSGYASAPQCYMCFTSRLCILLDWHITDSRKVAVFKILHLKFEMYTAPGLCGLCCRLHTEVAWFVLSSSYRSCMVCAVVLVHKLHGLCCRLHTEVAWFVLSSYRTQSCGRKGSFCLQFYCVVVIDTLFLSAKSCYAAVQESLL